MKEKIAKLLTSNSGDDVEIGKELLLLHYRNEVEKYKVRENDRFVFLLPYHVEEILCVRLGSRSGLWYITINAAGKDECSSTL